MGLANSLHTLAYYREYKDYSPSPYTIMRLFGQLFTFALYVSKPKKLCTGYINQNAQKKQMKFCLIYLNSFHNTK